MGNYNRDNRGDRRGGRRGDKPVYCSDCFNKSGGSDRRDSRRDSYGDKKMFKAVCDKCKKECEVPFRPTGGKPVFCDNCFVKDDKPGRKDSNQFNEQLAKINSKLDEILNTLVGGAVKAKPEKKEAPVKKKEAKPKKPAAKKKPAVKKKPAKKKK